MKNLKKYITFTNFVALFSFITLMLFFTPCFGFYNKDNVGTTPNHLINLFNAAFGCQVPNPSGLSTNPVTVAPCAGLILAFIFLILGIGLSIAKNKMKILGFLASAFYIASGILIACGVPMIFHSNYHTISEMTYKIGYYGWAIAVATCVCFSGFIALIDVLVSYSKPKVQEVY